MQSNSTAPAHYAKPERSGPAAPDTRATPADTTSAKPAKPYPDFPLFAHATGRWAKKIRGRMVYFGPWSDPDGALLKYEADKSALHAGRTPRPDGDAGLTVKTIVYVFLNYKQGRVDTGELSPLTWGKYKEVCDLIVANLGKSRLVDDVGPDDFTRLRNKMAKRWGALRVRDFVQHIRSVFKHGYDVGLMQTPMRFGPGFARPSKKTVRLERAERGPTMFTADELRRIIKAASQPLKAMILLGVNCGFGNANCGTLPIEALDLDGGWVTYHRQKTGINRRCPLWPETVQAIRDALALRRKPKDAAHAGLAFITSRLGSWHKPGRFVEAGKGPRIAGQDSTITKEMRKLLDSLGINGHRGFYGCRHTFETIGGATKDQVAVNAIMGHADDSMAAIYRDPEQGVSDERLRAVAEHVRDWLFKKGDRKQHQ